VFKLDWPWHGDNSIHLLGFSFMGLGGPNSKEET
jgi:hypothetical protein